MLNLNGSSYGKNIKTIPMVSFDKIDDCLYFDNLISNWLKLDKDIHEIMGLIFVRLGMGVDDYIQLHDYDRESNSFRCMINGDGFYRITFSNINSNNRSGEIILDRFDNVLKYKCESLDVSEIGIRIFLSSYSIDYVSGIVFTHSLSWNNAKFMIENGDNVLEFVVDKPLNVELPLFDDNGYYSMYKLDNEEALINYLVNLKFPVSIEELYEKICEISLGDVKDYPNLLLKTYKKYGDGKLKVIGLIHLLNGELQSFGLTRNNKMYLLNKDDSWSCERLTSDSDVHFSMNVKGNRVNCNMTFVSDDDRKLIADDVRLAQHEIVYVRRRAKKFIPSSNMTEDSE